jgi:hypothetical protein
MKPAGLGATLLLLLQGICRRLLSSVMANSGPSSRLQSMRCEYGIFSVVKNRARLDGEDWTGREAVVTLALAEQAGKIDGTLTVRYSSRAVRDTVSRAGEANRETEP